MTRQQSYKYLAPNIPERITSILIDGLIVLIQLIKQRVNFETLTHLQISVKDLTIRQQKTYPVFKLQGDIPDSQTSTQIVVSRKTDQDIDSFRVQN